MQRNLLPRKTLRLIRIAAAMSVAVVVIVEAHHPAYRADLTALSASGVRGMAFVTTTTDGKVAYAGWASGVHTNLRPSVCDGATNGCGAHIHNGTSCTDSTSQGGHHYARAVDPWLTERYTSDGDGEASFGSIVAIGTTDVAGKTFLIHDKFGNRLACGVLTLIDESDILVATSETDPAKDKLVPIDGSGVSGTAIVYHPRQTDRVCFAGSGNHLEHNLDAASRDCRATNGCGSHIHAGTSCVDSDRQGGHHYDPTKVVVDPWLSAGYKSTSGNGVGHFVGCLKTGEEDFALKPFVLHDKSGVRVACGMLRRAGKPETIETNDEDCGPLQAIFGLFVKVLTMGSVHQCV
jgi:hypothetical protein